MRKGLILVGVMLAAALLMAAGPLPWSEQELLINSPEFGDFHKAKEIKGKGNQSLQVWANYSEFLKKQPSRVKSPMLQGPAALEVAYDEIWVAERDYNPLLVVRREYRGKPFLVKLYWLEHKVQALTVEKYCQTDPLTWEKLDKPGYRIIALVDRTALEPELAKLAAGEQTFAALSPGAHLEEAQKALAAGHPEEQDLKKRTYGRLEDARRHLEAIQKQVKKLDDESKKALQEVENREKDLKKYKEVMQKAVKEQALKKREAAAKDLDRDFLSKGFDVKIHLEGSEKTTLKLESALFNRPMVFALIDKSDFLQNLRDAGFEGVVFANKNIKFTWEIDLNN